MEPLDLEKDFFNLINPQPDIDKTYLYPKDSFEAKYQSSITKREIVGLKHCDNAEAFIEYLKSMDDIYGNTDDYNPNKNIDRI